VVVSARVTDSRLYAHLWGTDELRAVFSEETRLQTWLDILVALASAQAQLGIIPQTAADEIARTARVDRLDIDFIAAETRATSHSTLGLIHGLQRVLSPSAGQHVYYGATVQDITDTWTALVMRKVCAVAWRDTRHIELRLLSLAREHRSTVMPGRTHGQQGSPITFGFKVASWADELQRHRDRLQDGAPRWLVGQLAGAVGTLGFFSTDALKLRARFCERLGLGDPGMSWTSSRDRIAEFANVMAMITATLARIGNEVYELQRPEIGELEEATSPTTVGSITMPHKRNPEGSEHLVTLSRLVRVSAALLLDGMVVEHERDGRAWKAEWPAFTEVCLLTATALQAARGLLDGLVIHDQVMARNVGMSAGMLSSERLLAALAPALGKHKAQEALQDALSRARTHGQSVERAVKEAAGDRLDDSVLSGLLEIVDTGSAEQMVDEVVQRCRLAIDSEPREWP
jgi:adenylosuccinate lyase